MPRPRVFVSSTYYDLKYIRNDLEIFISNYGFEPILFESGNVAYDYQKPLDLACYKEVQASQMLILLIGGRYGSIPSKSMTKAQEDTFFNWYNSITREEYLTAIREDIPTYIFIDKHTHNEYFTYLKNKDNPVITYAHADNINIFRFIEEIHTQFNNNLICDFERFEDIKIWLTAQWAGLFYDYLSGKKQARDISNLSERISDLQDITVTLRNYLEKVLEVTHVDDAKQIITQENQRIQETKDQKIWARIMESPMMKYVDQHTTLGQDEIFAVFCKQGNLKDFLQQLGAEKEEIEYILFDPSAESLYEEYKALASVEEAM